MSPQSTFKAKEIKPCNEDIVISGMSGVFPASRNVDEFESNLFNKVYMPNDDETRYQHTNPRVPRFSGKLKDIDHFDGEYFKIPRAEADNIDPQGRILLEEATKAILDAGVNPQSLFGTKTGVYIGSSIVETEELVYGNNNEFLYGILGCRKSLLANRISYCLGLTGPSLCSDTACSSSIYALDLALDALKSGEIDAAIVGGSNLCLHVNITLQFALLGVLSANGICRPFDADANGYCRSEAIVCLFLQRKSAAKRIYATTVASKVNCDGFKFEGITYPSSAIQEKLLKDIYAQEKIDLNEIGYMEAHSTATIVGDPEECKAIDNAIGKHRLKPLPIGSVKSNCGHSEPAAGACSLVKVLLALNSGVIPPNINLKNIKSTVEGLRTGRLAVVTTPTHLEKPYVGINSFGFGGANAHMILKQYHKQKSLYHQYNEPGNRQPRLITWSARTPESVSLFLEDLETRPLDFEYVALAHSAQATGLKGFIARGFSLLKPTDEKSKPIVISKRVLSAVKPNRKVVWSFNGIGAHWHCMGRSLLQLPLFASSIQKSQSVLDPMGINLRQIVNSTERKAVKSLLHSFVGITAVQIALIDTLTALGAQPDLIIGLSIGELACGYADGCLTAEEAILASYYCGKVFMEKAKTSASVAVVRAKLEEIVDACPKTVSITAYFSPTSYMITGPKTDVSNFVSLLKRLNIFAEELKEINVGVHSNLVAEVESDLSGSLQNIISQPKSRSNKWISTSIPVSDRLNKNKTNASAEYFVNNLMNCMRFQQILPYIPKDALVIDFGPPVTQRSIWEEKATCGDYIKLMPAEAKDDIARFLSILGDIYVNGVNLSVDSLYPTINFPVSRGTRCISSVVEMDHSTKYMTYNCEKYLEVSATKTFAVNSKQHQWLTGHEIDGRVLIPATFYLECVWRTLAGFGGKTLYESLAVEFSSIKFERATTFPNEGSIELTVVIHSGSRQFEITENDSLVVTGFIKPIKFAKPRPVLQNETAEKATMVSQRDFYKELKLRGYHYNGDFQGVEFSRADGTEGQIKWIQNWTTFMDCMLQMSIIGQDSRTLFLPTRIRRLRIYPNYHLSNYEKNSLVDIKSNYLQKRIVGGGIEIIGLDASAINRRRVPADPVLEKYQFLPHFPAPKLPLIDVCRCCIQIVLENQPRSHLQIVELASAENVDVDFLQLLGEGLSDLPLITGTYTLLFDVPKPGLEVEAAKNGINLIYADDEQDSLKANLVVFTESHITKAMESELVKNLENNDFMIVRASSAMEQFGSPTGTEMVAFFPSKAENYVLLKKIKRDDIESEIEVLDITDSTTNFDWIESLQGLCKKQTEIVLVAQGNKHSGIIGLTNCLRKEPDTKNIRCVFIVDKTCPPFDLKLRLFANQLKKSLGINVYKQGTWGTYRHLKVVEEHPKAARRDHVYAHIGQISDFSSLQWLQGPTPVENASVNIVYSSLNFKDVMQASGRLPLATFGKSRLAEICVFGFECSGIDVKTGKRIMCMTNNGAVATLLPECNIFKWEVPDKWTLEEAATVPVVYLTVYYAFFYVADIRKGKSILIHAGSGGVGIAAIRTALAYGLEVFTTVSTAEKRNFLMKTFPQLKENHIGNSRDNSFEQMIMEQTSGKGVDFLLNSLSEEKLKTSIRCLGKNGHFLEIGKYDMASDSPIEMGLFLNGITFSSVLADKLFEADESFMQTMMQHMAKDIEKGIIQPLPVTVFEADKIEQAYRFLMSGKHIGKVLLKVRQHDEAVETMPIKVKPLVYFAPDQVYIIPGGLGGFGLELVDWMIIRGARNIVLSSSRGVTNDYQKLRISLWKSYGCEIVVNTADISSIDGCLELLTVALKLGSVGGIFNLAVLLRDSVFQNQTPELFIQSFKPKAFATLHLDQLSRQLCPDLRHFVIFSSVSCGRGNAGQTNYGMANSIMERIMEDRVANGLPGKAVQWGAVGEVGLVAEMAAGKIDLEIGGTLQQRISSCLQVLDVLLTNSDTIVSSMVVAEKKASSSGQTPLEFVLNILSIRDVKTISMTAKLSELGLDSLTSVEIRQTFERDYGIVLNTSDVRSLTIAKLAEISENTGAVVTETASVEEEEQMDFTDHLRRFYGEITELLEAKSVLERISDCEQGSPIIVLPGIDGCGGKVWAEIGSVLNTPAYILQYHQASEAETLDDLVYFCIKHIAECLSAHDCKTFNIIGYSMGALLAHQVIAGLEMQGFDGKVMYIDGSPEFVQTLIKSLQKFYKGIEMEKLAMSIMLSLVLPTLDLQTIQRDLRHKLFKEEISTYVHNQLVAHNYAKTNEMMSKVSGVCQRLKIIQIPETYANIGIIDANVLLLRPTETTLAELDENYGLSLLTRSQVQAETLEGNHQSILMNDSLPVIINKYFKI